MTETKELLIATGNRGKVREICDMLADLGVRAIGLDDAGISKRIDETGPTFAENAALKAAGYARLAGLPTLADDSGLEIDALGGAPGIMSARWAGDEASDADRISAVLSELRDQPPAARGARFRCAMAVASSDGSILFEAEGSCEGMIAFEPRGDNGFGYDPIFLPAGYDRTFGELTDDVKRQISHRAHAVSKIIPFLRGFMRF